MTIKDDDLITVTLPRSQFIYITENHGGYLGGQCVVCGKYGWLKTIKHKEDCPVGKEKKLSEVFLIIHLKETDGDIHIQEEPTLQDCKEYVRREGLTMMDFTILRGDNVSHVNF